LAGRQHAIDPPFASRLSGFWFHLFRPASPRGDRHVWANGCLPRATRVRDRVDARAFFQYANERQRCCIRATESGTRSIADSACSAAA
jgi:hypothetical protein